MFKTRLATRTVAREGIAIRVLNRVVERPLRRVLHVQMVTISVEHSVFLTDVVPQHQETDVRLVLIRQTVHEHVIELLGGHTKQLTLPVDS